MSTTRLLVVDDDRPSRQALVRLLQREGFEVIDREDGRNVIALIEQFRPNLVVSDYEMPGLNGAEVCAVIRAHADPEIAALPIILLTAHTGESHEVECLEAGANDFVSKPVNSAILKARIGTHLRLHALRAELQQQKGELELWRHTHELDLEAAQLTQQAILPPRMPAIAGWQVAAHFEPKIQVGGDMYDWLQLPDGSWLIWIADATGHGASAALLTTLTKLTFRHAVAEMASPAEILRRVNAEFYGTLRGKQFMTAACLVVRPDAGTLSFAAAGHPPLLIQRRDGSVESIGAGGPPLGILPTQQCGESHAEIEPGETLLLYTDGLYSGFGDDGGRLSPSDVIAMLPGAPSTADELVSEAVRRGKLTIPGEVLPDDLAVVGLRRAG